MQREAGSGQTGSGSAQASSSPPGPPASDTASERDLCVPSHGAPGRLPAGRLLIEAGEKIQVPSLNQRKYHTGHQLPNVVGPPARAQATTPPAWPDRIASRPPGSAAVPPAHSQGDPVAGPVVDFCSAALCKSLPQRGPCPAILLAGPMADARTPRETPPASAGPHRGLLVPQHKEGRQRDPSSLASKVGGGAVWPQGPMQCGHRVVEANSPGPAPSSAAEDPSSRVGQPNQQSGTDSYDDASPAFRMSAVNLARTPAGGGPSVARPEPQGRVQRCAGQPLACCCCAPPPPPRLGPPTPPPARTCVGQRAAALVASHVIDARTPVQARVGSTLVDVGLAVGAWRGSADSRCARHRGAVKAEPHAVPTPGAAGARGGTVGGPRVPHPAPLTHH